MRTIISILLFSTSLICFGQDQFFSKNTIVYGEIDLIQMEHYNSPKWNPKRETIGFRLGASRDLMAAPNYRIDAKMGYRRVVDYAHSKAATFSYQENNSSYFNYNGFYTGVGINVGRNHSWESSIIIGGGLLKQPQSLSSLGEMEMGVQTGYMYVSKNKLVLRSGFSASFARNGFFSNMYSAYFGLGYALQRKETKIEEKVDALKEKRRPYFNVNGSLYIGNLSVDIAGINLRVDHFVYNGKYADIGYGLSARAGVNLDTKGQSVSASFISLFGEKNNKFEFSAGINMPFETYYPSGWEFVHIGFGYRYLSEDSPITFRVGTATTSILHVGVGLKFPY